MKDMKFYNKIVDKLENEDIEVTSFDGHTVNAKYGEIDISISFEMCICHGGRLSISSPHCSFYYRIEYEAYDKDKGIVDEESELLYEIENEMIPIIKSLKSYVYSVEYWRDDNPNHHNYQYYNSIERLSKFILEEDGMDIFAMDGEYIHYYPNPEMASKVTIEDFKDGKLYILRQDLVRKDGKGDWKINDGKWNTEHMICKIFKKGKKENG